MLGSAAEPISCSAFEVWIVNAARLGFLLMAIAGEQVFDKPVNEVVNVR